MLGSNFWSNFIVELTLSLCRVKLLCVKLLCPLNTTPFQAFQPILSEPNFQCLSSISKFNAPCLTLLPSTSPTRPNSPKNPFSSNVLAKSLADYQTSMRLCFTVQGPSFATFAQQKPSIVPSLPAIKRLCVHVPNPFLPLHRISLVVVLSTKRYVHFLYQNVPAK